MSNRKIKSFGFLLGKNTYPHEIKETTEKRALLKLVDNFWKDIEDSETIELLGELLPSPKPIKDNN